MKRKLIIESERCKGCGYCVSVCPQKALALGTKLNVSGYNYVTVEPEKCIGCGMCYITCPDFALTLEEGEDK